jgi:predicted outer membrane repeat protein
MVRDGTYLLTAAIDFKGKAITVRSEHGPGGCILDGQQGTRVVYFHGNESSSSVLQGFTVQNGRSEDGRGGGIYCDSSSPTISNCVVRLNVAYSMVEAFGGGIYCNSSSAIITGCTISSNQAWSYRSLSGSTIFSYGGGIYCGGSSPTITNCTIIANSAIAHRGSSGVGGYSYGGGMYIEGGSPNITGCTIGGNTAAPPAGGGAIVNYGGGIYCNSSTPSISNCTINNNSTDQAGTSIGGGAYFISSGPSIINTIINGNSARDGAGLFFKDSSSFTSLTNCAIVRNTATTNGGALYCENSSPIIVNSILYQNSPSEVYEDTPSNPTITYSLVTGGYTGSGNKNESPRFVNIAGQDFHLASDSPCIDAGDNAAPELPAQDKDGNARIASGIVDMGAYEYRDPPPTVTGSLSVTIGPAAADAAGAQWRVQGGAWNNSGDTVTDLAEGQVTVEFSTLSGWYTPASRYATITANQTTTFTVNYAQQAVKPAVSIKAADPRASEPGKDKAKFTISRTGATTKTLKVYYKVLGTAKNGIDYRKVSGTITIPIGKASASLAVTALDDKIKETGETIKARVTANPAYTVGSPASAVVTITDND